MAILDPRRPNPGDDRDNLPTSLHIVKNALPECTGICRIVRGLARHAGDYGYQVRVLFLGDGPLAEEMRAAGIAAEVIPWSGSVGDVAGAWRVWRELRRHSAEIVHWHHGGTAARMMARASGAHVVGHLHGLAPAEDSAKALRDRFRGADAMIACSAAVAASFAQARAEVVYAGVEAEATLPAPRGQAGSLRLGVVGRLIPLKNVEAAIAAVARLKSMGIDTELEIAGEGPSEAELRALAEALHVEERVRFLGWRGDVRALLATWDVLVMPSRQEGFPMAALEAMAAGRAVVATRVGGLCELVEDGVTGRLVPLGDVGALAECLAELAQDRGRLERLGAASWARAHVEFSNARMAREICAVYDRLLRREA